jgi:REP element-mobilizing transposase RayT
MADNEYGRLGKSGRTSGDPVWWDRGFLPHFESQDHIQHVCFHLVDSLPASVVAQMAVDLKSLPPGTRKAEKDRRYNAYLDAGHGACLLRKPLLAALVQEALLFFQGVRYTLHEWCIMPNHVHVLFQPKSGWTMSKSVASWKTFTGLRIGRWRVASGLDPNGKGGPVWQREYYDRYIRDANHYEQVVDYIRQNPVKAGLVEHAEDWQFSSARYFQGDR